MRNFISQLSQTYTKLQRSPLFLPIAAFVVTFIAGIILLAGGIINISVEESVTAQAQIATVRFTNKYGLEDQLLVEVADSPDTWERGLMYRDTMPANQGMIFVFNEAAQRTFWMKNTYIPLDIIFLDSNLRVVKIHVNTTPNQTSQVYPSDFPAQYALETNAGWTQTVGLEVGDQIILK